MAIRYFKEIASHKLLTLSAIFTGFALFYIRDSAWDDVFLPLLDLIGLGMNIAWPSWSTHRLIYDLIPMIIVWTYSALVGWLVARFHPSAPKAMVVVAATVWLFMLRHCSSANYSIPRAMGVSSSCGLFARLARLRAC